jgi:DNA-binding NarL/FixJ family response regulator
MNSVITPSDRDSIEARRTGILISRDLIFTSKITGTARELGCRILVAGDEESALSMIQCHKPRVVLIDLAAKEMTASQQLTGYLEAGGSNATFLAFGPHVDAEALQAAERAGCDSVMARSKFSSRLPDLIRQLFLETV